MNHPLYIGIDGGGTKTELLARRRGDGELVRRVGEGSNLQIVGLERSAGVLAGLVEEVRSAFGTAPLGRICVGLSGAGRPHEQDAVREALAGRLGLNEKEIRVVSDAEIAVEAAFGGGSGVLVIAGTGSMACGRTIDGEFACAGGWGRILGDEGSGYAIGRAGLQAAAAAVDGGPETILTDRVRNLFGEVSKAVLVRQVYGEQWPVQEFAPHVVEAVEAGDTAAKRILQEQTEMLARRVQWLARRNDGSFIRRIVLTGGLSNAAPYRRAFQASVRDLLHDWQIEQKEVRPADGALQIALSRT